MRGGWWKWLSAVLAIVFGLIFGWIAGTGLVQAAGSPALSEPVSADTGSLRSRADAAPHRALPAID